MTGAALNLGHLRGLAESIPAGNRSWVVWENTHCDPVVVEAGGRGTFAICEVSKRFDDYGRDVTAFIAAMDPETVLALLDLAEADPPCRCGEKLRNGTVACRLHPDIKLRTVRERIDFEQAFDAALARSKHKDEE
ncbi:hypothetical protein [Arthrobacter sp. IK3]|uniref:hypothetical protein n=1 Tax=Arthrobacter sp. IK3 TaxID=3448169 RepID=UPI003EDE8997